MQLSPLLWHKAINKKKINNLVVFLHSQCLLLAGQAAVGGHLSLTTLVAAYKNYSCPAPVTDSFFTSRGSPLTRVSTLVIFVKLSYSILSLPAVFTQTLLQLQVKEQFTIIKRNVNLT